MDKEQLEWLTALLDKLPGEFKAWAIVGVLILGAIWFLRKGKEEGGTSISVKNSSNTTIHNGEGDINQGSIVHKPKD